MVFPWCFPLVRHLLNCPEIPVSSICLEIFHYFEGQPGQVWVCVPSCPQQTAGSSSNTSLFHSSSPAPPHTSHWASRRNIFSSCWYLVRSAGQSVYPAQPSLAVIILSGLVGGGWWLHSRPDHVLRENKYYWAELSWVWAGAQLLNTIVINIFSWWEEGERGDSQPAASSVVDY